jgi:hypothetical protein
VKFAVSDLMGISVTRPMHVVHRHDRYPEEDTQKYYLPLRPLARLRRNKSKLRVCSVHIHGTHIHAQAVKCILIYGKEGSPCQGIHVLSFLTD